MVILFISLKKLINHVIIIIILLNKTTLLHLLFLNYNNTYKKKIKI